MFDVESSRVIPTRLDHEVADESGWRLSVESPMGEVVEEARIRVGGRRDYAVQQGLDVERP